MANAHSDEEEDVELGKDVRVVTTPPSLPFPPAGVERFAIAVVVGILRLDREIGRASDGSMIDTAEVEKPLCAS